MRGHGDAFRLVPPRAGAIAYPRYSWPINSTKLMERLRDEQSVLVVPGDQFGMDGFLRIGLGNEPQDATRRPRAHRPRARVSRRRRPASLRDAPLGVPRPRRLVAAGRGSAAQPRRRPPQTPEIGPPAGTLFDHRRRAQERALLERFLDLAGGPDAPMVLIPTARESDDPAVYREELRELREAGGRRRHGPAHARPQGRRLRGFRGPPPRGGRRLFHGRPQWRLADAYLDTRTHAELRALLGRGGVIGGTSAGATIQGSFIVRGDTKGNTVMIGDHVEGMGFLKDVTIDQHLLKRNRQFDLVAVIEKHPELLGIGIDEDTAIVVRGDLFEVIGNGYVAIYDHDRRLDSGGLFYLLAPGDRYDLKTREAERPQPRGVPMERVVKEPWKK